MPTCCPPGPWDDPIPPLFRHTIRNEMFLVFFTVLLMYLYLDELNFWSKYKYVPDGRPLVPLVPTGNAFVVLTLFMKWCDGSISTWVRNNLLSLCLNLSVASIGFFIVHYFVIQLLVFWIFFEEHGSKKFSRAAWPPVWCTRCWNKTCRETYCIHVC